MKILLTGGHFSPAHALIAELKKRGHEVMVAGRKHPFEGDKSESFEYIVAQRENIPFFEISAGRFQRKFTAYTLSSLAKTPVGFFTAVKVLSKARPDVVLTFGGYIGLPLAYAAMFLKIPVVLHEQTQEAGIAAKLIAPVARKICISFESSTKLFPKGKTIFTGNPIRDELFDVKNALSVPEGRVIYVTGGSTGSHAINSVIAPIVEKLLSEYVVIHQTGDSQIHNDYDALSQIKAGMPGSLQKKYILKKFILPQEVGEAFAKADIIISRAGVNTIFEIMSTGKVSLLIPLPSGQNNEQLTNAKLIKSLGIGEYIEEKGLSGEKMYAAIRDMFERRAEYVKNMDKTSGYIVHDAAKKIADIVESVG